MTLKECDHITVPNKSMSHFYTCNKHKPRNY